MAIGSSLDKAMLLLNSSLQDYVKACERKDVELIRVIGRMGN